MLGDGRIEAHRGGSIEFISLAANDEPFYFNHSQLPTLSSNPNLAGMTIQHLHRQSLKANIGRSLLQIVEAGDGASTIEVGTSALTSSATPLESTPTSLTGTDQPGEYDTNDATTVSTTAIGNNETSELGQSSSSTGSNDPIAPISFSSPGSSTESSSVLSTASILFSSSSTGLSSTGSSTGLGLSSSSTGTSPTSQFSQSNSTSSSSSSSSVYYSSSTGSHQPPVEPSVSNSFTPHPTAILLSYGGGLLFTHGTFIFLAPFQSSLTDGDLNSAASVNRNVANRFTVSPHAHVIFDQLPNLQSNSNHNSSVLPSDHLITATQFHNLGHLSVWNSTCNFTSILFFKSFGLLNFTSSSRVLFDISDNLIWNRLDGWNGWRGLKMTSRQLERRKEIIQFIAKRIEEDNTPMTTSNTPADNGTMSEDTPPSIPTNPTDESTSISTSLASLLSSSPLDPVINRCTSGGVGLIVDGFLVFRSGKMNFTGGILARRLSHIFVKKGSEWNFQLELSGSNFDDDTFNDPTAASFVQFGGIELSLDGVWNVRRGRLNILTPLLQIEGHGQLMAQGDQTRIRMDTERVNKPIHLMRMTGVTSEAVPTELIENPDIDQDQSADLYTFANTSATSSSPTTPLALPSYRESLISRCLISSGCESFLITDGARLTLAPLTFLHFLPRSMITVQSTRIEGGAIILDSNVYFRGNSFIQNSSDPSALVNGAAIATAGIHIGNESIIDITDITDGNSYTPATCMIAFGNITGNGRMRCQSRPIQFDSAFIYPSFYSTSPFSIITPVIPSIDDTMSSTAVESPSIRLIGDVEFTPQTTVMLDIFGFHSVSTLSVSGSSLLGGTLWLNGSLHEWPFDPKLINGSTANVNVADRNTSTNTSSMPLNSTSASPPPPTMDSILVFSSEMGLLPFTAPKHFTSIRLTSLIDILPTGFSLDFTYEKTPLKPFNMSQFIDPTSSIPMSPNPSTDHLYETQLWFRTYTPDFTPNQPKTIRNETNHGHRQLTVSAISFFLSPILLILLPLNLSPF